MKKTVYFETLGCPKNAYDSAYASGVLKKAGYQTVSDPGDAAYIVVNTCGFIEEAKRESIAAILDMAAYRGEGRFLVVTGCLTQRHGEELKAEMPEIDAALGVGEYDRLPELLDGLAGGGAGDRRRVAAPEAAALSLDAMALPGGVSAYLKVADGCDNRCAYCVIPYIRGPYKSRPMEDVLEEAERMAADGVEEIILIAQDLTAYGMDLYGKPMLPRLLRPLCRIGGLRWIRLMYCYEDRVTEELVRVMRQEKKICRYIDMPIQHASDKILRAMGRRSTKAGITGAIARLREAMPDIRIRTTLICGFPGETGADFAELAEFVAATRFDRLGVFAYSKEEGTPAAAMGGQVRRDVKERRLDAVMNLQRRLSLELNEAMIGRELLVLVEEENEDGSFCGRTEYDAPEIDNGVVFERGGHQGEIRPGMFVKVKVTGAGDYDLFGVVAEAPPAKTAPIIRGMKEDSIR
ncbi:MAG: 30S ribosomal protein S12 methylthiotransferase RimO [Clostridiales Family XIII bacterium]|jgi:ribosomal protein S12 methylthiotransferase|nr:30S ribosomal protein S12 methylthiotransferase RimO [Clostridiales Family XIII bacterium]